MAVHRPLRELPHVHAWWSGNESEKYWLEATDRKDLGANLIAPISNNAGQRLVAHVNPGDIVFHYYLPVKAIVALSVASGAPYVSKLRWPERDKSPERDAYCIDLVNYTELEEPITLEDFRNFDTRIRSIKTSLLKIHGKSVYFPFQMRRNVDPAQNYLSKFPQALIEIFSQITDQILEKVTPEFVSNFQIPGLKSQPLTRNRKPGSIGRLADDKKKRAVEAYAMKAALDYMQELGYACEDVSMQKNLGYDIRATKKDKTVGVEVKGSLIERVQIELQLSEIEFARKAAAPIRSLLFVLDDITCKGAEEPFELSGGNVRRWWDWKPEDLALTATQFRYTLPIKTKLSP